VGTNLGNRASLVWITLLGAIEFTDVLTTSIGRGLGAIETMPMSAAVMNEGGMVLFALVKFALVAAVAGMILVALRWMRHGQPGAGALYAFTLSSVRIATVALAVVSLHNAMLLSSLQAA